MFQTLKKMFGGKKEAAEVLSPVSGSVVPLSEVNDPAFAQEILGKGVAVKPSEGEFRAPLSGEVTVMFDTGHAVSIRGDNGAEVIVHIGLDTVQLKGSGRRSSDHGRFRADPCSRIRCDHAGPHLQYTGFSGYGLSHRYAGKAG